MSERITVQTFEGAVLAISASLPATYDAAGYGATAMVYTAVGHVQTYGEFGMQAQVNTFTPVDTGVVFKTKGTKDYGNMSFTLGAVPGNAGQDIIQAASESKNRYSCKVTMPTGDLEATAEIYYFDVIVTKFAHPGGAANDNRLLNVDFAVCRKPTQVAAT